MKESKFIELLNLYVDRQISPEDAALLEAEILQNPRRRQTYSQYCRMHRACTLALDRYQAAGEAGRAEAKVVAFEGPRRARWGYYVAGLAAACVALVAVHSVFGPGKTSTTPFARAVRSQPATMRSEAQVLLTSVHLDAPSARPLSKTEGYIAQQLRFVSPMLLPANRRSLAAADRQDGRSLPLQAPKLQLSSRSIIEDFVFAHEPATPDNTHIFRARQLPDDQAAMNAIEYQRQ